MGFANIMIKPLQVSAGEVVYLCLADYCKKVKAEMADKAFFFAREG